MVENYWRMVVSSLQDLYNANEATQFDDDTMAKRMNFDSLPEDQLQNYLLQFQGHLQNINKGSELIESIQNNLTKILDEQKKEEENKENEDIQGQNDEQSNISSKLGVNDSSTTTAAASASKAKSEIPISIAGTNGEGSIGGRQYWVSQYNSPDPIVTGSEVAYKPRKGGDGEWFQCEVIKVFHDRIRYEVRDPEPDELGNTGKVFKCSWKELILIPTLKSASIRSKTLNYPAGTKVLARYPETTTFYPAEVIGNKRDGTCRLRFEGEEEVDKETEVPRRLVLPFPMASSTPAKK
ncbi:similar to Saccharomyces cerevisiae YCL010C SGF29 Component of the HAT/Core module of the SAGA, SLIK, and ADA complexes [Maudiozyma saulgeensis]|uniref:Similar to Saccharomyces cerevisiae YCL010C SGF29 Component of the HAT/Core module of the SAGA, SLIK, and ADA complexes n=1 Tax=Maudiozyma saulgeensis TaxID=1789683 RepID=A0A1X7R9N8_9SACH|nr:similar to Saccharomyces cerevisiae YCL010C SGF29 Component of the HAT/Core module of the SAGA, SLIK, and ADA complexes [Kazachstania saulgeensis]